MNNLDHRELPENPQRTTITFVFKTHHNPGNETHLHQLLRNKYHMEIEDGVVLV